ncbi:dynamin family protein [Neobacillus sp. LXY-4]|uniref:dynamin family protein n=1 Tax=Neobacillus sp. LXY-4 TaxID=3379826 RepID=UPI003EE05B54
MMSSISRERFYKLADQYLPLIDGNGTIQSYKDYYSHKFQNLEKDEFVVPVLGVQGTGKSSFLNALLMEDIVLPVDVDETTCIPVEIRYSESNTREIEVYFNDKSEPLSIHEASELELFVHNAYNYSNKKNVSHVVIYKNNEILKNGVVFVDLPGVFSLNEKNTKTTMSYIENLSAAIFLLRTVPPITNSEKVFLSTVWPKLTKAWFIQNQWNDESKREVLEGLKHNKQVLQEIAIKHHTNEEINIQIVNVYQALTGRMQDRKDLINESGLEIVENSLLKITADWKKELSEQLFEDLKLLLFRLKEKLQEKLVEVRLDEGELHKKYQEQENIYDNLLADHLEKTSIMNKMLQQYEHDMCQFADQQSRIQEKKLRMKMKHITGNKVVDGERLTIAFYEIQRELASEFLEELNLKFREMKQQLEGSLGELKFIDMDGSILDFVMIQKKEAFKFEKGLVPAITIGGTLYGIALGSQVGIFFGGPIGTIIGGIVGLSLSLLSGWFGKETMEYAQKERGKASMHDLESPIQAFQKRLNLSIKQQINMFKNQIQHSLVLFIENQEREIAFKREENRIEVDLSKVELEKRRCQLEEDIGFLVSLEVNL